jgi:DNA-binding transcriptional LysR family regulator
MNWDDLRFVLAVSRSAGLNAAARTLGMNASSVYRRLEALEAGMGVRLFERLRSGYRLTPAGEELASAAARIEVEALDVERRVLGTDVRLEGHLRISTSDVLLVHVLAGYLGEFRVLYPEVRVGITVSNQHVDLSKRDADIVIRATAMPPENLVGRSVGPVHGAAYAAPGYLERCGRNRPLAEYDWIGYEGELSLLRQSRWTHDNIPNERIFARVDSIAAALAMAAHGLGCVAMPCFVAEGDPRLERIAGTYLKTDVQMWVLTHPDLRKSGRIRAALQFFGARLSAADSKLSVAEDPDDVESKAKRAGRDAPTGSVKAARRKRG